MNEYLDLDTSVVNQDDMQDLDPEASPADDDVDLYRHNIIIRSQIETENIFLIFVHLQLKQGALDFYCTQITLQSVICQFYYQYFVISNV